MELIVGFNLSSYSHCTSYTRLTTDTGNCCRACGWAFIKSTNIVIPYSRLLLTKDFFTISNSTYQYSPIDYYPLKSLLAEFL